MQTDTANLLPATTARIKHTLQSRVLCVIKDHYLNSGAILNHILTGRGGDRKSNSFKKKADSTPLFLNYSLEDLMHHMKVLASEKRIPISKVATRKYCIHHTINWPYFNFDKPTRKEILQEIWKFNSLCNLELVTTEEHREIHMIDYRALHNNPIFPFRDQVCKIAPLLGVSL